MGGYGIGNRAGWKWDRVRRGNKPKMTGGTVARSATATSEEDIRRWDIGDYL